MTQLDSSMHYQRDIQHAVTDFEAQKVCYLPLNSFYLKPYQRLLHYQLLLDSTSFVNHCTALKSQLCIDHRTKVRLLSVLCCQQSAAVAVC